MLRPVPAVRLSGRIAREDHQPDALARLDDLIVRFQAERHVVELAGHERLAVRARMIVADSPY